MCDRCGCDGDETPCDACSMTEARHERHRAEFEAWLKATTTCCPDRLTTGYRLYEVDLAWRAWSAGNAESQRLRDLLTEVAEYAHQHSTGPAVPDALWEVRQKAYEIP
jgi:hypothetical protein